MKKQKRQKRGQMKQLHYSGPSTYQIKPMQTPPVPDLLDHLPDLTEYDKLPVIPPPLRRAKTH